MLRITWCSLVVIGVWGASVCRAADTQSLAGEWRVRIDEQKVGSAEKWFGGPLAGEQHLKLPGTIDDAGLGPKNTKAPTLEGPYRLYDYAGPVWYQREIDIPANWQGHRVALFLERCRWVTTAWLDERPLGTHDSLIAPHVYELGADLKPGKHRLTLCVDNTVKLDLGKFVSALFGGTWGNMNGVVGRIELSATPPVWIDDIQVYPDIDQMQARVAVKIGNASGKPGSGKLTTATQTTNVTWDANGGQAEVVVKLPQAKLWDEFSPEMTELSLKLGDHERTVKFGMRKFAIRGTQFTLNGRPVYLRGTLECSIFPLTGYPPTDVPAWQRIYKIMKSYGLNHIRFHSWCPPDAAFAAADLEGIFVQAEGPQANVQAGANPARDEFIAAEFRRIVDTYGNHPSFCTMTLGNEYGGKGELLSRWVQMLIERDPRHLYSSASAAQTTDNRQWTETHHGRGIHGAGTDRDLRAIVAADPRPVIGHEIGQWMYYPNFDEMRKYTGVMAPRNFEIIKNDLEKKHQLDLVPKYIESTGKLATLLYKEEIEVLLRTRGYAGFSLLDLHDYPTQGTALVGPLDPFWDSKGFIKPEEFRRYCGPTVPLLRLSKRTYTTDEILTATAEIAHYAAKDLPAAQFTWVIKDGHGDVLTQGQLPATKIATGQVTELGKIEATLAKAKAPAKYTISLLLPSTEIENAWDVWVYPASNQAAVPPDVVVCNHWNDAQAALKNGKKVVLFAGAGSNRNSLRGRFLPVFWSPVWFPTQKPNTLGLLCDPQQPLWKSFPTDMHTNWQWYDLLQQSRYFILDDTPAEYRPLLQVIDNFARNHKLGLIFEGRVGPGQLLVCGFNLPSLTKDPAARQLLASLYAYAGSPAFQPAAELKTELLDQLFVGKAANNIEKLGGKVRADSHAPDYGAALAIDGDPNTMWHTPWDDKTPKFPHELIVELPQPANITGITCLPRQDNNVNGQIKDYAVFTSTDGKYWGSAVATGQFARNADLHTVKFKQPVTARFVKLTANSSHDKNNLYASLAEFDLLLGAP